MLIIPLFIPHEGCPHRCLFCNQLQQNNSQGQPIKASQVTATITTWLRRQHRQTRQVQVAFYGGSFTALPWKRQRHLLTAVQPFLARGAVQGIRLSTRPDGLDAENISRLQAHGVRVVELGVQSMDDRVLQAAGRGYRAACVVRAVHLLRTQHLQVGLQLMLGLPLDTPASFRRTCRQIQALRPDFVRIYPLLVLRHTRLATTWRRGAYQPLSLARAVVFTAAAYSFFIRHHIQVIRMGLQPTRDLEKTLLAGPYHPAFGELVYSRIMYQQALHILRQVAPEDQVALVINPRDQSIFNGWRNTNRRRLRRLDLDSRYRLYLEPNQPRFSIGIRRYRPLSPKVLSAQSPACNTSQVPC